MTVIGKENELLAIVESRKPAGQADHEGADTTLRAGKASVDADSKFTGQRQSTPTRCPLSVSKNS
jgi:hypothetical protein